MDSVIVRSDARPLQHGEVCNRILRTSTRMPKFAGTMGTYFAYGVAQGEVGTPPAPPDEPDNGVDNATLLGWSIS